MDYRTEQLKCSLFWKSKIIEHKTYTMKILSDEFLENLNIVLDFVERFNKQDKYRDVAEAAGIIEKILYEQGFLVPFNEREYI